MEELRKQGFEIEGTKVFKKQDPVGVNWGVQSPKQTFNTFDTETPITFH